MEKGFYHPDRGYWQTTNEPPQRVLDGYPDGTVEVPLKTGDGKVWDGSAWVDDTSPAPVPDDVPRGNFLVAAAAAGFITEATAEEAADGTWPAAFNMFLSGLNAQQRVIAKANWSTASNIRRDAPLLAQIANAAGASSADLDDIFIEASKIKG